VKAVVAEAIAKRFDATTALDRVSFDIDSGELFGFTGPDGAGKTTLFRILVTLLEPDAGHASVLGRDVVRQYQGLRQRVGYMAGRFSLYPDLSVEENLRFFASVFGTSIESTSAHRTDLRAARAVQGPPRGGTLRGHETEAGALLRARAPPGNPDPRRADHRR
jgi:ABC-type multidrug transport system ATPase subunit